MESSAAKRRKMSPTASMTAGSTTPRGPSSQQQAEQHDTSQIATSRSSQGPSLASPTRSSLLRQSPEIISRGSDAVPHRPDDIPASEPTRSDEDVDMDNELTAQLEGHSEGNGAADASMSASQPATIEPGSVAVRTTSDVWRSPSRKTGGSILSAQSARRTPTRPQPRPLPPPGPEEEEVIANPFERRGLHRSPLNMGVLPAVVHEEPELPPTPEHPDSVVSTPPSGIHNTPTKRRREPSEREAMRLHSSPSKHPLSQEIAGLPAPSQKESQKARGKRGLSPVKSAGGTMELPERSKEKVAQFARNRSDFAPGTHPRRSVRLRGPDWEKVQKRDMLLKEVEHLEADLELAKRGNHNTAKRLPLTDKDKVLNLLRRHLVSEEKDAEQGFGSEWLNTVMDPIVMLGFNGFSAVHLPTAIPNQGTNDEPEPPIISHHPISMTASEELPFLQMFSPLTFTSSIATISPSADAPDQTSFQKHTITVRSASPPGLFAAQIEFVVHTLQKSIFSLAVPRLDPAAIDELRPFIDSIVSAQAEFHPAKTRNVNIVCWAMGEWYKIALKRAKFWVLIENSVNNYDGLIEFVRSIRARKRRKHRRQRQLDEVDTSVVEGAAAEAEWDSKLFTRGRLLSYMGQTSMDLEIPYLKMNSQSEVSELRVKWAVEFDWSGDAKSKLGVEIGVPGKWQALDERKSIVGIPKLFDKLLEGGEEPLAAVKTVVALLAGEPRS